jgi:hypothetical protein
LFPGYLYQFQFAKRGRISAVFASFKQESQSSRDVGGQIAVIENARRQVASRATIWFPRYKRNRFRFPGRTLFCRNQEPAGYPMREYTFKEKSRITVGAIMALVIVGWLLVLATAFLSVR